MSTHPQVTFGDRLRRLRLDAGLDQEEMGDLLLSGRNSVGRWEGDRSRPPARKLRRWVEIVAERTTYEPDSVVQFLGLPPVIELDERRRMDRRKPPQSPMWISLIAA